MHEEQPRPTMPSHYKSHISNTVVHKSPARGRKPQHAIRQLRGLECRHQHVADVPDLRVHPVDRITRKRSRNKPKGNNDS